MPSIWCDPFLFAVTCLGGGGLLLGLGCMLARQTPMAVVIHGSLGATAVGAGVFAILARLANQPMALWGSAGTLAGLYAILVVLPSPVVRIVAAAMIAHARSPRGRLGTMLAAWAFCPFFALWLVVAESELPVLTNDELAAMMDRSGAPPDLAIATGARLTTDSGRQIVAQRMVSWSAASPSPDLLAAQTRLLTRTELREQIIYVQDGWQNCNCHGFVFAAGEYWIAGQEVETILHDNGYHAVAKPQIADLVVYRDDAGKISHTAIVRGFAGRDVILVESKWGQSGRFIHRHDRHPYASDECVFFRSARVGHALRGIYLVSPDLRPTPPNPSESDAPPPVGAPVLGL